MSSDRREEGSPVLSVQRLSPHARLPTYMTEGAVGLDLYSAADLVLPPGERAAVGTGIALAIPPGFEGQVRPRSGLALHQGITLANSPGTIDSDYRGEVCVLLINLGRESCSVRIGDRVAQLVVVPVVRAEVREVSALTATVRGSGGFGHTGS